MVLVAHIVDDIKADGSGNFVKENIHSFQSKLELGTVKSSPEKCIFMN